MGPVDTDLRGGARPVWVSLRLLGQAISRGASRAVRAGAAVLHRHARVGGLPPGGGQGVTRPAEGPRAKRVEAWPLREVAVSCWAPYA